MKQETDKELRVLMLEDVATDAELIERALRKAGLRFKAMRVDRKASFERALDEFKPDIVLSDYNLPDINGLAALKIAQEKCPDVPVIEVTGALGDEAAVELVRTGAKDYVLKDRLARLPFAVQRALSEAEEARRRKKAEEALRRLNCILRTLSSANQALVRAKSEPDLLRNMCQVLIDVGGYRMAWIGIAEHNEEKTVRVAAVAGHNLGYIEQARVSWADSERGRGPTGMAIRTGQPQINRNFATDPRMGPWRAQALERGYASSAALPLKDATGVFAVLTIYAGEPEAVGPGELDLFVELAADLSYGIAALRAGGERETAIRRLYESLEDTVGAIASTIELRDPYTAGHQRRVAKLAVRIAGEMGLPEDQTRGIFLAGLIHDIGKINVPAEILGKPGELTPLERQFIRTHPQGGYDIIKGVEFPWPIAEAVLQHHERLDGSGYPRGLAAEAVIAEARILAVADVTEAITAHRPYRPALGLDAALAELEAGRGRLYDPAAVDACVNLFRNKGFAFQ